MSKTRNQLRRSRLLYRIALAAVTLLLIALLVFVAHLWVEIEQITAELSSGSGGPVHAVGAILPSNFDEEAYEIALQRYDAEHGEP